MLASLGGLVGRDVHLKADAVNRHALRAQPLHEIVDAIRLLVQPLAAIVVVEEQRLGICLPGQAEGISDVLIAELLSEHRVAQSRAIVGDRFVDDVPREDPSAIMFGDGPDVIFERHAQVGGG